MTPPTTLAPRIHDLLRSYEHWMGTALCRADELFTGELLVLAHGTETPPTLWYASSRALDLWEVTWEQMSIMPSRDTAEPGHREQRALFMEQVARDGHVTGYTGVRVSRTGRRFLIEDATVWNTRDQAGQYSGQAAAFRSWRYL